MAIAFDSAVDGGNNSAVTNSLTFSFNNAAGDIIVLGQGGPGQPVGVAYWRGGYTLTQADVDGMIQVTNWQGTGKNYRLYENYLAPANAVTLEGLVNAKAVETGTTPPPPPTGPPPPGDPFAAP